ncbi:MAG: catalase family protein [Arenicella sp.]
MSQKDQTVECQKQKDIEGVTQIQLEMMKHMGAKIRGQHFKQHGCLSAEFSVLEDIPDQCKVGIFAKPKTYKCYIRYSNGGQLDDRNPDIHGMAIKLLGVPGKKVLEGQEGEITHDFILADNPVFFIRTASDYVPFIEEFAQGKPPAKFAQRRMEAGCPMDLEVLKNFSQQILDSPLSSEYWSQVPYSLGKDNRKICRYSAVPTRANPTQTVSEQDRGENYLREAMKSDLAEGNQDITFDFMVQPNDDSTDEVINNPTVEWDLPNYKVATITISPQIFDTDERDLFGENLSYTPWRVLPEHRPLGEVNEVRKQVYLASSALRHRTNGAPSQEPKL